MRLGRGSYLSDAQAARWASIRARGRSRFIVVYGLGIFGICGALIHSVITQFTGAPGPFWGRLAIALLVSPLFGIGFARSMWSINERWYHAWSSRDATEARRILP